MHEIGHPNFFKVLCPSISFNVIPGLFWDKPVKLESDDEPGSYQNHYGNFPGWNQNDSEMILFGLQEGFNAC